MTLLSAETFFFIFVSHSTHQFAEWVKVKHFYISEDFMLWLQIRFEKKKRLAELGPLDIKWNSKMLVRNQIIFIWGWMLIALSRVEHFILKQGIDLDNSKASQRTKSLASSLRAETIF